MSFCKFGVIESEKIYLKLGAYSRGLPVEYSQFLERTNGGIFVEKNPIYIEDFGKEIQIDVLYGIHENQRIDLHFWNEIQNYKKALHRFSIVIGDTTNHGFIVYQFRNADPGIYFWDICGALESSAEGANAYRIADNFSDFLVMLGIKNEKNNRFKIPKNPYNLEEINDEILLSSEDGQTTQKINIAEYRKSIQCFSDFSLLHRYTKAYKIEMLTNEGLNKIESAKGYKFSDSFRKFVITQNSHDSYYMVNHQADDGSPFILLGFYEGAFESAIERNLYCNDVKNAIESGEIEKAESLMQLYKRFIIFAENENEDFAIDTVSGCIVHINHNTFTVRKIADNFDEFIEQPYVPQAEAEKTKEFELLYKEKQSNMVTACLEYALGRADKIFIYCSAEGRIISSSYFYEIDGKAVDRHELKSISPSYDTSSSRQQECLGILNENIKAMKYLCEKYDRIMPTEIKMIYDVKTHSIEWEDNYKLVHSNHKTKGPNDFANEWFKEVKSELERIEFEEKKRLEVNSVLSKDIIDALNKQRDISFEAPATPQEINDAQKRLNLKFSDDYIQFLLKYGSFSSDDIELAGISVDEYSDVVYLTETIKGYEYNEYIPSNWYVIEDVGIDGLVAWQDEKGRVYLTLPGQAPQKYADSLVEYIIKATAEEDDETTENTQTDSANEVCEFENNDFEKTGSLTDEEVRKLEEKMGKNFPADYKLFLLKTNGGRCNHEHEHGINVADIKEEPIYIDTFFGIDEIKACDLFYWNSMYGEDIPEEAIIIGDALSNGFIIYNYSVEDKGIYYWDSSYTFECSSDEWNTYFMAKDFNELLKLANIKIDDDKDFVVKDAVEQAGDLFSLIDGLENLFYKNAATLEEIEEAEKRLGVKFAEDYVQMLLKYGFVSSTPLELAGISVDRYLNVVYLTETTKEYEYNEYIPFNWYVIEDVGVDELIAWQDEKGRVYLTLPGQAPQKYADSLVEYIIKATAEEEDETTENAQTDSANEVCEFKNNSSQKDFIVKDADEQAVDILSLIDGLENLYCEEPATLEEIAEAEKRLGVKFAEEYVQMLLKYGTISSDDIELVGLSADKCYDVVHLTETIKEYEYNKHIPSSWYIIENVGIDGLVAWQDEKGRVYLTLPGQAPQKYADSLVEYIIKATAEEEDETTENAQTDSDNFAICDKDKTSDGKVFEDLFMEMQSDMVVACLKYVNGDADKIYIYGSAEGRVITSDYFYEIDGMVVERHKLNTISPSYDVSSSRQKACLEILNEDLKDLKDLCKEHDRPMPTEMKMVYNVKTGSFETAYKYEPVYSNHETKTANDIVDKWYEQVKKETEKK